MGAIDARQRRVSVGFRVTPETASRINAAVARSGLSKQEYIERKLMNEDVLVKSSSRVLVALEDQLAEVADELRRVVAGGTPDPETMHMLRQIIKLLYGFECEGPEAKPAVSEEELLDMQR